METDLAFESVKSWNPSLGSGWPGHFLAPMSMVLCHLQRITYDLLLSSLLSPE